MFQAAPRSLFATHTQPTIPMRPRSSATLLFSTATLVVFMAHSAAVEVIKLNNTTSMNTSGSWTGGVIPGAGDVAVFNDTFLQTASVGTGGAVTWLGAKVIGTKTSQIIVNNNTVTNLVQFGAGGLDMSAAPRDLSIASLNINGDQTWNIATGRTFYAGYTSGGTGNERINGGPGTVTIKGGGTVEMRGTNGSPGKLHTANLLIQSGATLRATAGPGLGTTAGTTTIQNGGSLVINSATALNFQGELVSVAGSGVGGLGAIQSVGAQHQTAFTNVTLTGNATFATTSRFDIRDTARAGASSLDLAGFTLTKIGADILFFDGCTVTPGNLVITEGLLGFQNAVLVPASPGHTVFIANKANLRFWRSATGTGPCVFAREIAAADGAIVSWNGSDTTDAIDQSVASPIIAAGLLTVDQSSANSSVFELTGVISGPNGSLLKTGAGTAILAGANTFPGTTTVQAGRLDLTGSLTGGASVQAGAALGGTGSVAGAVTVAGSLFLNGQAGTTGGLTVAAAGMLNPGGTNAPGSIHTASLALTDAKLTFETAGSSQTDAITIASGGTFTATGNTTVDMTSSGGWQVGDYLLLNYSGGTASPGLTPFQLIANLGHASGGLVDTGTAIALRIAAAPSTTWAGTVDAKWDLATGNWQSADQRFLNGDTVIFNDSATANFDVLLAEAVVPGAVTFANSSHAYRLSGTGSIGGVATILNKSGAGTAVIETTNSYAGGTTVNGGTLALLRSATNELPSLGTGPVAIGADGVLQVACNGTMANSLSGAGKLLKGHPTDDTFTTFTGNNSYTGLTTVTNGSLVVGSPTALGASTTGTEVADAARLFIGTPLANASTIAEPVMFAGGPDQALADFQIGNTKTGINFTGPISFKDSLLIACETGTTITFAAPAAITYAGTGTGADVTIFADGNPTISGVLELGTGSLTKTGAGTLTLTHGGNHYGGTTVTTGTLTLSGDGILGNGTNTVAAGAFLTLSGTLNAPFSAPLTGAGILLKSAAGNVTLGVVNGLSGGTRIDAGLLLVGADGLTGAGPLHVNGGALASTNADPRVVTSPVLLGSNPAFGDLGGVFNGQVTYTGHVDFAAVTRYIRTYSNTVWATSSGNGGMTQKLGTGSLTLKGTHDWSAGAAIEVRQGTLVLDGATVTNADAVRVDAAYPGETARLVLTNGAALTANLNTANLRIGYSPGGDSNGTTNVVDLGGTLTLASGGTGGLVQMGTLSAATRLNLNAGGNLLTASIQDVNTASNDVMNCDGGKLTVIANSTNSAANTFLQGLDAVNVLDGGLTIDTNGNPTSINQALLSGGTGVGGLIKQGAGTLTLGAVNRYGGATVVEAGTLALVAPGTTGTGPTTVSTGATLTGTGTVTGPAAISGTVAPGTTAGVISIGGALTLKPDSSYRWEVASWTALLPGINFDTIVAATLDLAATTAAPVKLVIAGTPADFTETAMSFPLIQTTGGITHYSPGKVVVDASAFTGTGSWQVIQEGNNLVLTYALRSSDPYDAWAGPGGFNLTGGKFDDDDHDGVANALEFILKGDPTKANDGGLQRPLVQDATAPVGNQLTLVAAIRRGAVFSAGSGGSQAAVIGSLVCTVTGGTEPGAVTGAVTHVGVSDTAPPATTLPSLAGTDWEYHTFSLDASEGLPNRGFLRVKASAAP